MNQNNLTVDQINYLERMLSVLGFTEEEQNQLLVKLMATIRLRAIKELLAILPEDQKAVLVGKIKNVQSQPTDYLKTILGLIKDQSVREAIVKAVEEELGIFEQNFLKVASEEQKKQLLDLLKKDQAQQVSPTG